jgi:hypothetical protein
MAKKITTYDLCTKLGKILSQHIKSKLYHQGILRTVRSTHSDVKINVAKTHRSLKESIVEVKRKSEKTIAMLQEGIDLIESLPRKK